ncbi:MAG: uracil-DNA glycosylase, partial [Dehalococcoidia bacterium]|nr:uracil-DNA glycosylase [Dehalococcoidia bacterium]
MSAFANLKELIEAARKCTSCGLCKGRTQVVPGEGLDSASLMFVGEGPGFHEDKQGRPFVGPAGKLLDELIESIGLKRSQVYITNLVKCRPPGNRDPLPEEIQACRPWLNDQIDFINPTIVVTLGRHAMGMFLPGESIARVHGMARKAGERLIVPMYHPAAALYQQSLKKTLEADFSRIPEMLVAAAEAPAGTPGPHNQQDPSLVQRRRPQTTVQEEE